MRAPEAILLDRLAPFSRLDADQWEHVVKAVEAAGSIFEVTGTARYEIDFAADQMRKANPYRDGAGRFAGKGGGGAGAGGSSAGGAGAAGAAGGGKGSFGGRASNGGATTARQSYDRSKLSGVQQKHYDDFRRMGLDHASAMQSARRQAAADARGGKFVAAKKSADEVEKINPYHDGSGRFAPKGGGGGVSGGGSAGGGGGSAGGGAGEGGIASGSSLDRKPNAAGTQVKVVGAVNGKGKSGVIIDSNSSGTFHTVEFSNGKTASYHGSDLVAKSADDDVEKANPYRDGAGKFAPKGGAGGGGSAGGSSAGGGAGGGASAGDKAKGAEAAASMNTLTNSYKANLAAHKRSGPDEAADVDKFHASTRSARTSLGQGDLDGAADHIQSAIGALQYTGMNGLINGLSDIRSGLLR